jgi:hypothetical protein
VQVSHFFSFIFLFYQDVTALRPYLKAFYSPSQVTFVSNKVLGAGVYYVHFRVNEESIKLVFKRDNQNPIVARMIQSKTHPYNCEQPCGPGISLSVINVSALCSGLYTSLSLSGIITMVSGGCQITTFIGRYDQLTSVNILIDILVLCKRIAWVCEMAVFS